MQFINVLGGIALTVLCWGIYGPSMHRGQQWMDGSRLRPFVCVGVAYLLLSVVLPAILLGMQGELFQKWTVRGVTWSLFAGAAGAVGAMGIIIAMTNGGKPTLVMPLVFGCAPVVSVFFSMWLTRTHTQHPGFYAGLILVSLGAAMIMMFQPKPPKAHGAPTAVSIQQEETNQAPPVKESSAH